MAEVWVTGPHAWALPDQLSLGDTSHSMTFQCGFILSGFLSGSPSIFLVLVCSNVSLMFVYVKTWGSLKMQNLGPTLQ